MSGNISVDKIQLGNSITPANNFVIQTNTDGTAKLARGNIGSTISDIFNVDVAGNNIFNAKVGIGIAPTVPLQLRNSTIDQTQVLFSGITKGIRFVTNSTASAIEGVDYTGVGSYQPLNITGSILNMNIGATNALNIDSSGNVGIGIAPSAKLQVSGHMMVNDSSYAAYSVSNTAGTSWKGGYQFKSNGTVKYEIVTDIGASGSNSLSFYDTAAATTRLQIGPSGQFGIGGTNYGTAGQALTSGGPSAAPSWGSTLNLGTAVVTTSGTSATFTSIPSWVKRITLMFIVVSTNGSSIIQVQLGTSSGIETAGYVGAVSAVTSTVASSSHSNGFLTCNTAGAGATASISGSLTFSHSGSNVWCCSGVLGRSDIAETLLVGGAKTLSGILDRISLTTVNGTDTFDAGSVNIIYE